MDTLVATANIITLLAVIAEAVPPDACFQNFRWDDCGKEPKPVMYYWKPGSRCEVGIWRGCRPNFNMFKDEYECVTTCIFSVRAQAPDFHNLNMLEEENIVSDSSKESGDEGEDAMDSEADGKGDVDGDGEEGTAVTGTGATDGITGDGDAADNAATGDPAAADGAAAGGDAAEGAATGDAAGGGATTGGAATGGEDGAAPAAEGDEAAATTAAAEPPEE